MGDLEELGQRLAEKKRRDLYQKPPGTGKAKGLIYLPKPPFCPESGRLLRQLRRLPGVPPGSCVSFGTVLRLKQAPFRKRGDLTVADDQMVQRTNIDQRQRILEPARDADVRLAGFRHAGRVVVRKDQCRRVVEQ